MSATCGICVGDVPLGYAVHATIHTKTDAGVVDDYVCRPCYEDELAPLFER